MKKFLAILLVVMMMSSVALADVSRTYTVAVEGGEVIVTETLFSSEMAYAVWYPSDIFSVTANEGYDAFYYIADNSMMMTITAPAITAEDADGMLAEGVGNHDAANSEITYREPITLVSGAQVKAAEVIEDGVCYHYYLVTCNDQVLCINSFFPVEYAETLCGCVDAMIETLFFNFEVELYCSELGYNIGYPVELVTIESHTSYDLYTFAYAEDAALLITAPDVTAEEADALLDEAAGNHAAEAVALEPIELENGILLSGIEVVEDGLCYTYYLAKSDAGVLCVSAVCPIKDASVVSLYLTYMVITLEL